MRIKNLPSIESMDGSQDALVIEQTDGSEDKSRKVSPSQLKQYILNDMDEVPTQDSDDPVKSGGVFSAIDDIYSVMGQNGAKNLIPYPYYHTSKTTAGITITDNGDGTLTFNGTSTSATVIFRLTSNDANIEIPLNKSKYILTWVDSSEHKRYFRIDITLTKSDGTTVVVNGESGVINIDNTNGEYTGISGMSVYTANNQTVSNLTFKPMLRLAADTDNTYQPYAKTNKQLTETIGDLTATGVTGASAAAQIGALNTTIGDLSQTTVTGDTVAAQLKSIKNVITFDKVPDSFITLQSGISIVTNQVYKQGNHIFGWITFGFSAQTPSALKLGVLNSGYRPSGISRMMVGLGTQPWTSEYAGYCLRDSDYSLSVTGYNASIRAAHIHLDYVV